MVIRSLQKSKCLWHRVKYSTPPKHQRTPLNVRKLLPRERSPIYNRIQPFRTRTLSRRCIRVPEDKKKKQKPADKSFKASVKHLGNKQNSEISPSVVVVGGKKAYQRQYGEALVPLMDNCSGLAFGKQPRAATPWGPIILANASSLGTPKHASVPCPARATDIRGSQAGGPRGHVPLPPTLSGPNQASVWWLRGKHCIVPDCQNNANQGTGDLSSPVKTKPQFPGSMFFFSLPLCNLTRGLIYLCWLQWLQNSSSHPRVCLSADGSRSLVVTLAVTKPDSLAR